MMNYFVDGGPKERSRWVFRSIPERCVVKVFGFQNPRQMRILIGSYTPSPPKGTDYGSDFRKKLFCEEDMGHVVYWYGSKDRLDVGYSTSMI
jgi:hypothetical protein